MIARGLFFQPTTSKTTFEKVARGCVGGGGAVTALQNVLKEEKLCCALAATKRAISSIVSGKHLVDEHNIIKISTDEAQQMAQSLKKIEYSPAGSISYITQLRKAAYQSMPAHLLSALEQQRCSIQPKPYIIIDGLPHEKVTGAPHEAELSTDFKKTPLSENLNVAIAALIGEPYSIGFEGKEIVNNLVPAKHHENAYTGLGSLLELSFHIENAALKHFANRYVSPMGLLLQGVRHDNAKPLTRVADSTQALQKLSDIDLSELKKAQFIIKTPMRWRGKFPEETKPCAILTPHEQLPDVSVAFYPDMVTSQTKAGETALNHLRAAIEQQSIGLDITPGTMVYVDNRLALHARDAFKANFDQQQRAYRWLQP